MSLLPLAVQDADDLVGVSCGEPLRPGSGFGDVGHVEAGDDAIDPGGGADEDELIVGGMPLEQGASRMWSRWC